MTDRTCVLCGTTDPAKSPRAEPGDLACWQDDEICSPCADMLIPDLMDTARKAVALLTRPEASPVEIAAGEALAEAVRRQETYEESADRSAAAFEADASETRSP